MTTHINARMARGTLLAALYLGAAAGTPAVAQSTPGAQSSAGGLQEIIVTAEKRAERVQDVPIAIDALDADAITARHIVTSDDLVKQFPDLSLKTSSSINSGFSIRGVGTQNFHLTAQQAVGEYLDEVSLVTPFTSQLGLFDLERIEVLRGPQNTLFGRNTTGGAVNYLTHKPSVAEGVNGYAVVNVGNFGRLDGEGAFGMPLSDTVAVRAAAQIQSRDGVFHNLATGGTVGSTRRYSGRVGVSWQPSEDTSALLSGHVGYNRGSHDPRKAVGRFLADGKTICPANNSGVNQFEGSVNCYAANKTGALFNPSLPGWRQVYDVTNPTANVDFEGGLLKVTHKFSSFTFMSLTSFDQVKVLYADESSGLPYLQFQVFQQGQYDTFAQEMRLTSRSSGRLKWVAGALYSHDTDNLATIVRNNEVGPPTHAVVPSVTLGQGTNIKSLYGQVDFLLTKKLNLDTGLRWTSDDKSGNRGVYSMFDTQNGLVSGTPLPNDFLFTRPFIEQVGSTISTPCGPGVVPCTGPGGHVVQNLSRFAGKIGLDYHFTPDVMGYASISNGFKSGSFDVRAQAVFNGSGNKPVKPESLNAFEVGVKSSLVDHRVQLNGDVFYYDWKDLQAFGTIPGIGPAFLNVPKSRILGEEIDLKIAPGAKWLIEFAGAHLDSKVVDAGALAPAGALNGSPLQNAPAWTFNGNISKAFNIGKNELTALLSPRYIGEQYFTLNAKPDSRLGPAFFLDASLTYDFGPERRYSASLWGENLTDEKTCNYLQDLDGFTWTNSCIPNEGTALYGLRFMVRF